MTRRHHASCRTAGFSLIEVLVTMIVVSLGLLGFAALQAQSVKSNRVALQRSYATMLAYDILDSMRVNKPNLASYALANHTTAKTPATCSDDRSGSVADDDLKVWLESLCSNLPAGAGRIVINDSDVTISVQWQETVNSAQTIAFSTDARL